MGEIKREIEVTMIELAVAAAARPAKSSRHLLGTALIWPRVGTARRTHSSSLILETGSWRMNGRPWTQRILFKETVQGSFGFEVVLTEMLTDEETATFMRTVASQVAKLAADAAEDLLSPPPLGDLAAIPFDYLVKAILEKKAPATLGVGTLDLDSGALPEAGGSARWELPLISPEGLRRTVRRKVGDRIQRRSENILARGEVVGRCLVDVRVL